MILTKQIFDTLKKAGIRPQIGKFTNTRLLSEDTLYNTNISDFSNLDAQQLFNKIKFESEFLPQATESQLSTFLENIRTFETMNPNFFTKKTPIYSAKTGENLNQDRPQDIKTLVDDLNKDLKGKSAFQGETVNPKTGEVRELQTPIRLAEESNTLDEFDIKDREPNAMGGIIGGKKKMIRRPTPKNISSDLLSILKSGIGSQFKVRG